MWPLSLLFSGLAARRRRRLSASAVKLSAPLIVVGNISLGGTGKTPLIIALVKFLRSRGLRPGVLSRGYGGQAPHYPYSVVAGSDPRHCGDEPLLIAREAACPVAVDRDRVAAGQHLIREHGCNILLSDDGLQHYRLARQWEIAVIDGRRGLGNGLCLPAGPLREPPARLQEVDCVVINGTGSACETELALDHGIVFAVNLLPSHWCNVKTGERVSVVDYPRLLASAAGEEAIDAVTGIGNPGRFFDTLRDMGLKIRENSFPDHHPFCAEDLQYAGDQPLLMTAKDAVKCQPFAKASWWYLAVGMPLPDALQQTLADFLVQQGLLADHSESS
nr:tetraacyldisaccharide 4'-kinase [Pseudomaricurvus alcaniphilus]